jgi:hypothetical protein
MLIELPTVASNEDLSKVRVYRLAFFHFSNNNLAIRRNCAEEIGGYDLDAVKSEDVDLSFRFARSRSWIAIRERGCVVRHKARKNFPAFVKQMWGWGYHLGYPYSQTKARGLYVYCVSSRTHRFTFTVEWPHLPVLICIFPTDFHLAHLFLAGALCSAALGAWLPAAGAAAASLGFLWRYSYDDRRLKLPRLRKYQVAALHYCANVVFIAATFIGGLRRGILLLPANIFRPGNGGDRTGGAA